MDHFSGLFSSQTKDMTKSQPNGTCLGWSLKAWKLAWKSSYTRLMIESNWTANCNLSDLFPAVFPRMYSIYSSSLSSRSLPAWQSNSPPPWSLAASGLLASQLRLPPAAPASWCGLPVTGFTPYIVVGLDWIWMIWTAEGAWLHQSMWCKSRSRVTNLSY